MPSEPANARCRFALPNGAAYYAYLVRRETTTALDAGPDLSISASRRYRRIRTAMQVQIAASGFSGDFASFQAMLRRDPRFYVTYARGAAGEGEPAGKARG